MKRRRTKTRRRSIAQQILKLKKNPRWKEIPKSHRNALIKFAKGE